MYRLSPIDWNKQKSDSVINFEIMCSIPFDPANTDYQRFKKDVAGGETLENPEGVALTQAEADAFLETLP